MPKGFGKITPQLSLCMIVKNEADHLAQCLTSAKPLVDEMIIVDTGSTDDTLAIAQQFTKHLYHYKWQDDFSSARNFSLTKASGTWILMLDGDEELLPESIPALRQIMQQPEIIAINLMRQEINAQQAPYSTVCRLFRNRPDLKFWGIYHETIEHDLILILQKQPKYKLAHLDQIAIVHYGYSRQALEQRHKQQFAERLMTKHLDTYPDDPYMQNKLGALMVGRGNYNRAIELLLKSWQTIQTTTDQDNLKYEILYHLGYTYEKLKEWQIAQIYYAQALQIPTQPLTQLPGWNNLGAVYYQQQDWQSAIVCYQEAISIDPQCKEAYHNLGLALRANGELEMAEQAYAHAIRIDPDYASAYQNLGALLLNLGKIEQAEIQFNHAIALYQQQGDYSTAQALQTALQPLPQ